MNYMILLHGSSQCCGTLRSLGLSRLLVVNYFSIIDRCSAYNVCCQGKLIFLLLSHVFRISASSTVTYQPQCIWLLRDVNVFGKLLFCRSTPRMVANKFVKRHTVNNFFHFGKKPCNKRVNVQNAGHYRK